MPVLIPKIQKLVRVEQERIIREQITPWIMGFATGKLSIENFDKKKITYGGIGFEGSPRNVFWSRYIEPFLEDATERLIAQISQECVENNLNLSEELQALAANLRSLYSVVFGEMVKADQSMRGKGYPDSVPKTSVTAYINNMNIYLAQHVDMEIAKYKSRFGEGTADEFQELSDSKHQNRIKNWEKYGVEAIEKDLLNGGITLVGGPPAVRELAWKWVRKQKIDKEKVSIQMHQAIKNERQLRFCILLQLSFPICRRIIKFNTIRSG